MRCFLLALALCLGWLTPLSAQTYLGKSLDKWVNDLSDKDPAVRRGATYALGKLDSTRAVAPLKKALKDDDKTVREGAASALGDLAGLHGEDVWVDASDELLPLLKDREPRVRRAACYALGRCGKWAINAAPELCKSLEDESPTVRQNAAKGLGQIKGDKADTQTVKALATACKKNDEDPYVSREIVNAIAAQLSDNAEDNPEATQEGTAAMFYLVRRDPDRLVLKPALLALQKTTTRKQGDQGLDVVKYLDDKDAEIRRAAAFTLANAAGPKAGKAMKVLLEVLTQGTDSEQDAAAGALANLGETASSALADLARILDDTKRPLENRFKAAFAISRIRKGIDPIVPSLVKAVDAREDPRIRELAAEAMSGLNFSEDFKNKTLAQTTLVQLLKDDPQWRVRQRALWALYTVPDLKGSGALDGMVGIVKDKTKDPENKILRYDTARVLALRLGRDTVDEAIDALVDMLSDPAITVYVPSETRSTGGSGAEGMQGGTTKVVQNRGGDARYMAALGLAAVGPRVKQRKPNVIELLQKLKESKDPKCVEAADQAIKSIGG